MVNVLLVDQDKDGLDIMKELIRWESYSANIIGQSQNGIEALKVIEYFDIALVIVDINTIGMSWSQFIEQIRENEKIKQTVYFAIMAEYMDPSMIKEAFRLEVLAYFIKPIKSEELIEVIQHIERKRKKEVEYLAWRQAYERIKYNRAIIHVMLGKYTKNELGIVKNKLLSSEDPCWRVISFELDKTVKEYKEIALDQKLLFQNQCATFLKRSMRPCSFHITPMISAGRDLYGVLLVINSMMLSRMNMKEEELIQYIYYAIGKQFGYSIKVYIGVEVKAIDLISESFRSLNTVRVLYDILNIKQSIIRYDDLTKERKQGRFYGAKEKNMVHELVSAINHNDCNEIIHIFERYSQQIDGITMGSLGDMVCWIMESLKEVMKGLDSRQKQMELLYLMERTMFDQYIRNGHLIEVRHYTIEFMNTIQQIQETEKTTILDSIEEYLIKNYDLDITLKQLGEKFYINSVYLGQLFKRKYGMPFREYLTNLRINKSLQLLVETDLHIYKIAEKVGFQSADYFISKFVQLMGMTPQQYRNCKR